MSLENLHADYQVKKRKEPLYKWLKIVSRFPQGNQGTAYMAKLPGGPHVVAKISDRINYITEHEYKIMTNLHSIAIFCPHFCRALDCTLALVDPGSVLIRKPEMKYPIHKSVLIEEHIGGKTLEHHIGKSSMDVIFSGILQTLFAVMCAQRHAAFTHYDLHSNNVLMEPCDPDIVCMYVYEDGCFLVPTHGHMAKIIDFGFAYSETCEGRGCTCGFTHTELGFTSDRFDSFADYKVFLVSVLSDLRKTYPKSTRVDRLERCVRKLFGSMAITWGDGWDDVGGIASIDIVIRVLKKRKSKSRVYKESPYTCLEIIQSLITLPIENYASDNMISAFDIFFGEFVRLEKKISKTEHLLYILQAIVESAKIVMDMYLVDDTRDKAVTMFRRGVVAAVDQVSNMVQVDEISFEKMLCSVRLFAECMEGILFRDMQTVADRKRREYAKIPLEDANEVPNVIYFNTRDDYNYSTSTRVLVLDSLSRTQKYVRLSASQARRINDAPAWLRAPLLQKMLATDETNELSDSDVIGADES